MAIGGGEDGFLAKFSKDGQLQWATYFGGFSEDRGYGVSCDNEGNIILTGYTFSDTGLAFRNAFQNSYFGDGDAFVAKFNNSGKLLWAKYFGSNGPDIGLDIASDIYSNIYITGKTISHVGIATPGAHQTDFGGGGQGDAFVAKFNSSGKLLWSTYYGGEGDDVGAGIVCDGYDNVYVTGTTGSQYWMATPGAYQTTKDTGDYAFLGKFSGTGQLLWVTYYGGVHSGVNNDGSSGITGGAGGNIYISGFTSSASGITTPGAYQPTYAGNYDAFLAQFSSAGNLVYATYYGGPGEEGGRRIAYDGHGHIYLTGTTTSPTNITTHGCFDSLYLAGSASQCAFLAKFGTFPGPIEIKPINRVDDKIIIYPNPANDAINISWENSTQQSKQISILNMAGQRVYSANVVTHSTTINVNTFPPGRYICVLQNSERKYYSNFTVVR